MKARAQALGNLNSSRHSNNIQYLLLLKSPKVERIQKQTQGQAQGNCRIPWVLCSCARVLVCSCARVLVCSCARVLVMQSHDNTSISYGQMLLAMCLLWPYTHVGVRIVLLVVSAFSVLLVCLVCC